MIKGTPTTIVLLVFLCSNINAQRLSTADKYRFSYSNRLLIRCTPTALLGRYGRYVPVGAEYCFWRNMAVILEQSIPFSGIIRDDHKSGFKRDFAIRTELRVYIGYGRHSKWFLGAEAFTKQQAYHEKNGHYLTNEHEIYEDHHYDAADIKKSVNGGAIKCGVDIYLFKNVFMELFAGMGVKQVNIGRDNITGLRPPVEAERFMMTLVNENTLSASGSLIYFPIGISFSYLIGNIE